MIGDSRDDRIARAFLRGNAQRIPGCTVEHIGIVELAHLVIAYEERTVEERDPARPAASVGAHEWGSIYNLQDARGKVKNEELSLRADSDLETVGCHRTAAQRGIAGSLRADGSDEFHCGCRAQVADAADDLYLIEITPEDREDALDARIAEQITEFGFVRRLREELESWRLAENVSR